MIGFSQFLHVSQLERQYESPVINFLTYVRHYYNNLLLANELKHKPIILSVRSRHSTTQLQQQVQLSRRQEHAQRAQVQLQIHLQTKAYKVNMYVELFCNYKNTKKCPFWALKGKSFSQLLWSQNRGVAVETG